MKFIYTLLLAMATTLVLQAQHRQCASMDNLQEQLQADPKMQVKRAQLEAHIQQYEQLQARPKTIITIPVVFHIVHNGDAVGSNENISDALIYAQIDQLNDDFRLMNSDANLIPAAFLPLAADTEINFALRSERLTAKLRMASIALTVGKPLGHDRQLILP
ncbi:MAG: hypothetical protein R2795_01730 [Saprospiraceae bacterium]